MRTVRDDICVLNPLRFLVAKYHNTSEVTKRLYTVLGWHILVVMVIYINHNCHSVYPALCSYLCIVNIPAHLLFTAVLLRVLLRAARRIILGADMSEQQNLDKISLSKMWYPTPGVDINVSIFISK